MEKEISTAKSEEEGAEEAAEAGVAVGEGADRQDDRALPADKCQGDTAVFRFSFVEKNH